MRRGVWLLIFGVLAAALAAASARADGTTTSTTTDTSTTTAAPTYARLTPSFLPAGCVGAGAAAIAEPGRKVLAVGTPASGLGPSAYPATTPIVSFDSSTASGSACTSTEIELDSVSLFGGVVTASSVDVTDGTGMVNGLEVGGSAVTFTAGQAAPLGNWGQLTLGTTIGRLTAPLVVQILQRHDSLPAGTTVAVAFTASAQPVAKSASARQSHKTRIGGSQRHARGTSKTKKTHRHQKPGSQSLAGGKPPLGLSPADYTFLISGGFDPAAQDNGVVSTAMQYLGIPYKWAGSSPKTGFDCSGLVKYVFAKLGVSLPHNTVEQWNLPNVVSVPPNQLQPGDLVFFTGSDGTRKAPGHVGIYISGGYIIDAPHTGSFVRIDSFSERWFAKKYVGAKRISASLSGSDPRLLGTPTLAGSIMWPQPIARHLLNVTRSGASANGVLSPFVPLPLEASGVSPLRGAGIQAAAAHVAPPRSDALWLVASGLGAIVALSAGAFTVRRRRRTAAESSS